MSLIELSNFVECLQQAALSSPNKAAFIFLANGEEEQERLNYILLLQKAQACAGYLQEQAQVGDRILLCYVPGLDFIVTFMACLLAGMIAVPAYPLRNNHHAQRLVTIINDCEPVLVLGTGASLSLMQEQPEFAKLRYVFSEQLPNHHHYHPQLITPDMLAFLQYTSGSTGSPKGVMVSHGNILANMQAIHHFFSLGADDKIISWLPMQHDMGLIGQLLYAIFLGSTCVLMPPNSFLEKPLRWLQAITRYRGYAAGGPNFGFELCVEKISQEQLSSLDLSCWQTAFNGSEPIRAATLKAFAEKFSVCGFNLQKFLPCYGMAETTLLISGKQKEEQPQISHIDETLFANNQFVEKNASPISLVSSGAAHASYTVQIVNPDTKQLTQPKEIGEIWVSGPCVAQGYWNKPELTTNVFSAKIMDDNTPYLRTGDLGYLHGKQLYVTGRLKDLIILQGRNIYPQDIEKVVELAIPALQPGCTAAFSVEIANQEQLVIVAEIKRTYRKIHDRTSLNKLFTDIRQSVIQTLEVIPHSIRILAPTKALRTTSGKIQRQATKTRFLNDTLSVIACDDLAIKVDPNLTLQKMQQDISELLAKILGIDYVDPTQPFTLLGGSSLEAITFHQQLQLYLGEEWQLPTTIAFDYPTVQELTNYLFERLSSCAEHNVEDHLYVNKYYSDAPKINFPPLERAPRDVTLPLSINEQAAWVAMQEKSANIYLNMKTLLFIDSVIDKTHLESALCELIQQQEILRTTYHQNNQTNLYRKINNTYKPNINFYNLENYSNEEQEEILQSLAQSSEHKRFSLDVLPLFELNLVRLSTEKYGLIFCMHHIIGDGGSVVLFLKELMRLYLSDVSDARQQHLSFSYTDYAVWQQKLVQAGLLNPLLTYWEQKLATAKSIYLPYDRVKSLFSDDTANIISLKIDKHSMMDILQFTQKQRVTMQTVLMGAFLQLLKSVTSQNEFLIETILANRTTIECKNMLGALAVDGIALYSVPPKQTTAEFLSDLLQQMLIISKLSQDCGSMLYNTVTRKFPGKATVGINFHGQNNGDFPIPVKMDASYFSRGNIPGSLDLFLEIWPDNDEIVVDFIYRQSLFKQETVQSFAQQYLVILQGFLAVEAKEAS